MKKAISAFLLLTAVMVFLLPATIYSQPEFPSSNEKTIKKDVGFTTVEETIKIPYLNTVDYFGYITEGAEPDAEVNGKKAYFIYMWVPVAIEELGVRMISPVDEDWDADDVDFVTEAFQQSYQEGDETMFDTWIRVERMDVIMPEDIKEGAAPLQTLGEDDDSDDTAGDKLNSLLRLKTDTNDPMKALVRGLYRITFTTYKTGEVQGSFVATVGTNVPGVKLAPTLEKLAQMVNE